MDSSVSDVLKQLLAHHGRELCSQRQRLEGLLRDFAGQHRQEVTALVAAVREGVAEEIRAGNNSLDAMAFARLTRRLKEEALMMDEWARWAVLTWCEALGKSVQAGPTTSVAAKPAKPLAQAPKPAAPAPVRPPATPTPTVAPVAQRAPSEGHSRRWWWLAALVPGLAVLIGLAVRQADQRGSGSPSKASTVRPSSRQGSPPASARRGDTWTNPRDGAEMVYIPAGDFLMGSDDSDADEKPQRRVHLDSYWLYQHEVTVAQYRKFCQATGTSMPGAPSGSFQDKHPIANVSWNDAKAYCDWAGVALPTEAQWEKAARGTDGRKYPWGNEWDAKKCNTSEARLQTTTPVGAYPAGASPYGCLDTAGNVWEWCADWYDANYYKTGPERNPTGPAVGQDRVLRGGSWDGDSVNARCADRLYLNPGGVYGGFGFRCARTPSG